MHYDEEFCSTLSHLEIMNPVSSFLPPKVTLVLSFSSLLVINTGALEGQAWKTTPELRGSPISMVQVPAWHKGKVLQWH